MDVGRLKVLKSGIDLNKKAVAKQKNRRAAGFPEHLCLRLGKDFTSLRHLFHAEVRLITQDAFRISEVHESGIFHCITGITILLRISFASLSPSLALARGYPPRPFVLPR